MRRILHVDPGDAIPIWRQLEEGLRRLVASGTLGPGDAVPSVRELARQFRINPATVAKAYQRLTMAGVLQIRRGEGTFVAQEPPEMADGEQHEVLRRGALRYASLALTSGTTRKGAVGELNSAWDDLASESEGTKND